MSMHTNHNGSHEQELTSVTHKTPQQGSDSLRVSATSRPPSALAESEKIACIIDLGSNSARLLVVKLLSGGAYTILNRLKHMVRLGENAFETKQLQDAAMDRTLEVLHAFASMRTMYGASQVVAVATAAVRDAKNGKHFIEKVRETTGLPFTIISGKEEARLIWLGVSSGLPFSKIPRLYIDIGGGSTELIVANSQQFENLDSLKIGCVRLTNHFLDNKTGPVSTATFNAMKEHVLRVASHEIARVRSFSLLEAVASSGTAQALHHISKLMYAEEAPDTDNEVLTLQALRRVSKYICAMSLDERKALPGINERRAEVLVAGAAILQALLEELDLQAVRISARTLMDGVLEEKLRQIGKQPITPITNVRETSINQLGKRCQVEELHARHVSMLALALHDSAIDAACMPFNHTWREILQHAAFLHDIGIFIAYSQHAAHGHYLIRNSELLGFTEEEIDVLALLTLFHNKIPSRKHPALLHLDKDFYTTFRLYSLYLALAENMDRLHCQHVTDAKFIRKKGDMVLQIVTQKLSSVEQASVQQMTPALLKVFGEPVEIQILLQDA